MRTLLAVLVTALSLVTACDGGDSTTVTSPVTTADATTDTTSTGLDAFQSVEVSTDAMSRENLCVDYADFFSDKDVWYCPSLAGKYYTFRLSSRSDGCWVVCNDFELSEAGFRIEGDHLVINDGYFDNYCSKT